MAADTKPHSEVSLHVGESVGLRMKTPNPHYLYTYLPLPFFPEGQRIPWGPGRPEFRSAFCFLLALSSSASAFKDPRTVSEPLFLYLKGTVAALMELEIMVLQDLRDSKNVFNAQIVLGGDG